MIEKDIGMMIESTIIGIKIEINIKEMIGSGPDRGTRIRRINIKSTIRTTDERDRKK